MSESVLTILCHILEGEKLIAKHKQEKEKEASSRATTSGGTSLASMMNFGEQSPAAPVATVERPEINPERLQTLMDMGFPRERCVEAIQNTTGTTFLLTIFVAFQRQIS